MSMRLFHVIPTLQVGGAATQLRLLTQGLTRQDFDVHVCCFARPRGPSIGEDLLDCGVELHSLDAAATLHAAAWWRLVQTMRVLRPDVVHIWGASPSVATRLAAIAAGMTKVVVSVRSRREDRRLRSVLWQKLLISRTSALVSNHDSVQHQLETMALDDRKLMVIRDGIATRRSRASYTPSAGDRRLTDDLGIPRRSKLVGIMGPLIREKRIKDAIWAIDLLSCVRDDVHLVVLGDGGSIRADLETFARQVEVDDRVHFLGTRHDVTEILKQLHVFWLTSEAESMSNGLMEAMAAAVPVIATKLPSVAELVVHERTGLIINVGNRGDLARATIRYLDEPQWAKHIGEAGQTHVLSRFPAEQMVEQYIRLYRQLCGNGHSQTALRRVQD
jgi:glycosyltransferase involved in cell wall biosynthesis